MQSIYHGRVTRGTLDMGSDKPRAALRQSGMYLGQIVLPFGKAFVQLAHLHFSSFPNWARERERPPLQSCWCAMCRRQVRMKTSRALLVEGSEHLFGRHRLTSCLTAKIGEKARELTEDEAVANSGWGIQSRRRKPHEMVVAASTFFMLFPQSTSNSLARFKCRKRNGWIAVPALLFP